MKKIFFIIIAVLTITAATVVSVKSLSLSSESGNLSDVMLANVEALAQSEALPYESIGCKTERCDADPSPNWVTSSVKRTCYVLNNGQYSSCTGTPCGEVFYGCN